MEHNYTVFAFRAVDEPELCEQYIKGHIKILTDYGITNITSNNNAWTNNPNIYCLGLKNNKDELLGGIRIQLANGIQPLPIEDAIGYLDKSIYKIINYYAENGGIGELSGLWVDNRLKGLGIGWYMVRAAIASSNQLGFKTMIGICGDVTLRMFNNVGFRTERKLGENGQFYYPNEELIAHAVGILDAITLENAVEYDRRIMKNLRLNIIQTRTEIDTGKNVLIQYKLKYPKIIPLKYKRRTSILDIHEK